MHQNKIINTLLEDVFKNDFVRENLPVKIYTGYPLSVFHKYNIPFLTITRKKDGLTHIFIKKSAMSNLVEEILFKNHKYIIEKYDISKETEKLFTKLFYLSDYSDIIDILSEYILFLEKAEISEIVKYYSNKYIEEILISHSSFNRIIKNYILSIQDMKKQIKELFKINQITIPQILKNFPKESSYWSYSMFKDEKEIKNWLELENKEQTTTISDRDLSFLNKKEKNLIKNLKFFLEMLEKRRIIINMFSFRSHLYVESIAKRNNLSLQDLSLLTLEEIKNKEFYKYKNKEIRIFYRIYDITDLLNNTKDIYLSFEENSKNKYIKNDSIILKGIGITDKKIVGRVKVIKSPNENIEEDEILVTYYTNPEYLHLMKKAKGIITQEGGITSHAALVSKELNIPCIVGVKNIMSVVKNGDYIEMDCKKGIIKLLNSSKKN